MTPPDTNAQTDQRSNPLRLLNTYTHWCFSAEGTWKARNHLCLSVCHLLSIPTLQAAIERHLWQRRKTLCVQAPLRALFCFTEARPTSAPFTPKEVVITPLLLALWLQLHTKEACEVGTVVNKRTRGYVCVWGGCIGFRWWMLLLRSISLNRNSYKTPIQASWSPRSLHPHPSLTRAQLVSSIQSRGLIYQVTSPLKVPFNFLFLKRPGKLLRSGQKMFFLNINIYILWCFLFAYHFSLMELSLVWGKSLAMLTADKPPLRYWMTCRRASSISI